MVGEVLWPETAPWWLNLFIWMAYSWQYIMAGFIPAFYIAVVKLFGMPLLQRWQQEVVIMLYPNKVKFGKITDQTEPYFRQGKGLYWFSQPLQPEEVQGLSPKYHSKMDKMKTRCEELAKKESRSPKEEKEMERLLKQQALIEKKRLIVRPVNQVHIYTHAVNQAVYDRNKIRTKVDDLLNAESKPKKIKSHGIWIMQNPKLHFHRHYQLIVSPSMDSYRLIPVKQRQQFSIGFWHSIGVSLSEIPKEEKGIEGGETSVVSGQAQLLLSPVTTNMVLQQIKAVQSYQNFSASQSYRILKRRARLDEQYEFWITGSTNPIILFVLIGAVVAIGLMVYFMHGNAPPTQGGSAPHGIL